MSVYGDVAKVFVKDDSSIQDLVDKVIKIYMKEDYDYVVSQTKKGIPLSSADYNIKEEIEFLKRNNLIPKDMSKEDIRTAAKLIITKMKEINKSIGAKYNKTKDAGIFPMIKKMRQENYALELTISPIDGSEDNGFSGVALVRDRDDIKGIAIARKGFSGWTPGQVSGNAKKWFLDFVKNK